MKDEHGLLFVNLFYIRNLSSFIIDWLKQFLSEFYNLVRNFVKKKLIHSQSIFDATLKYVRIATSAWIWTVYMCDINIQYLLNLIFLDIPYYLWAPNCR